MFYNKKIFQRCFRYEGRYWYKNIKEIPLYFRLIHHLVKHGYDEYASWETFSWFISIMKSILIKYREGHQSIPIVIDNYPWIIKTEEDKAKEHENEAKWESIVNRMIELLDDMDEYSPKYDNYKFEDLKRKNAEMEAAKNEFFELFSKYFYDLWD